MSNHPHTRCLAVAALFLFSTTTWAQSVGLLSDIATGTQSSNPSQFTVSGPYVYFTGNGTDIWLTDGTSANTIRVAQGYSPNSLINVNGTLFWSDYTRSGGNDLFLTVGTSWGCATCTAPTISSPPVSGPLWASGTKVYFQGYDSTYNFQIWKSDGTGAGTVRVTQDVNPNSGNYRFLAAWVADLNSVPFFFNVDRNDVWTSDGTWAGSSEIFPGVIRDSGNIAGTLYFSGTNTDGSFELFRSDGTSTGTSLIADICPGANCSSNPTSIVSVSGTAYFAAVGSSATGRELWKSDGTANGTQLVADINPGSVDSVPENLTNVGGTLFFTATTTAGVELWKSDGTASGTTMVKDIKPGAGSSNPSNLVAVNGTLYFFADDGSHGTELWKSDGTAATTKLVSDIYLGATSSDPQNLVVFGGRQLLFAATDQNYGREPRVVTLDLVPDALSFSSQTDVSPSTTVVSAPVAVSGIDNSVVITVANGEYSVNGGAFVTTSGYVINGDTIRLRHISAATYSTSTSTTATIGGVQGQFLSTTVSAPSSGGGGGASPAPSGGGGGGLGILDIAVWLGAAFASRRRRLLTVGN